MIPHEITRLLDVANVYCTSRLCSVVLLDELGTHEPSNKRCDCS